ncbi:MAG: MarR family winged helix-turn-helix transcriptional regulator [Bacillota bacterium]
MTGGVAADGRPVEPVFRTLLRTCGLVGRIMQPFFARFGVSGSQWGILRTLYRAEQEGTEGLRLRDLGERLLIRPPSVTGVVGRLERQGLVVSDVSTKDLRAKQVRLTPDGRAVVRDVLKEHADQVGRMMGGLNEDEQRELQRLLVRLTEHLEGMVPEARHRRGLY